MKILPLMIALLLAVSLPIRAQIISDIIHEPFRDKILLTYNVNGLTPDQRMEVNLYCSDDNYKAELLAISGNGAGAKVAGNGQKTIIWDVLRSRTQLVGKVSFEIRAIVYNDYKPTDAVTRGNVTATREELKTMTYSEMSSSLGNFIIHGKDLVESFKRVNENIYEDNLSLRKITDAVINYNSSFNKLNSSRMTIEKQVLTYWENEALYNDVRYLFDFALGELHTVNVLELNNTLNLINDINLGKISGRKHEKEAREKVMASVIQNTSQLEKRLIELERRANRILYTISNR